MWNVLGRTILCLRSVLLLFLGCMNYGICSAPWMVQCTSRVLHVVSTMPYLFAYCALLLLYLVGLLVCSFNQTIHIYVCKLMGGYEVLISGVSSYLFFLAVVICPTIGDGSLNLHYIVLLWSGSWISGFLSMHCCPCDYLGGWTGNWYPWFSWPFLQLSILCCLWYGTLGWFRGFLSLLSIMWKHISSTCHFCSSFQF